MNEEKFATIIWIPTENLSEVGLLCGSLQRKDPSFKFEIKKVKGQFALIVYSQSKNQARQRGEWLVTKTDLLNGLDYKVTHQIALEAIIHKRPKKVMGLREYWKSEKGGE